MRRLRPLDAALLAVLLPLWVTALALHVRLLASGRLAWVGVYVRPPERGAVFPTVRAFWPGAGEVSGLALGDGLVQVGAADLHGVGPLGFVARAHEQAGPGLRVPVTYVRGGASAQTMLPFVPVAFPWRTLPLTVTFAVTGTLVLLRLPGARVARAFFLAALSYALHWTFFFGGPRSQTYLWAAVFLLVSLVTMPLMLRVPMLFPPEAAPAGGRLPRWPWLFAAFGPISTSWMFGVPLPPAVGLRAAFATNGAFVIALLALLTRNFRRASPVGRRQVKWVVYGVYVGTMPVLAADVVSALAPRLYWLHDVAVMAEALIPLCILIAILRFNLFDIDRLITATAAYTCLTVVLSAALLTVVPRLAALASAAAAVDETTAQLVLSLIVAAGVVPGQRYLGPRLERWFFAERHALRRGVEQLLADLSACGDAEQLLTLAAGRLDGLLRPRTLVIYGAGEPFAPVFERGLAAGSPGAPPLAPDGRLIEALRGRGSPLDVAGLSDAARALLAPAERDVLERLRAAVLLPLRRGGTLAGLINLGEKRSGDVYTATDLALLAAVVHKVSGELLRFSEAEILARERAMREALGRYVPAPVAARLASGREIEGGERELTVLFVDIRGYTSYAEARAADAVFSVVSRYTDRISRVVGAHGGTVVEFLGDGLMAVFGAPDAFLGQARAAVAAARDIVVEVRALEAEGEPGTAAVGVGIATGRAFVGNIRADDRLIYTAIGDTVNLASRLQGLTRELGAAVAIDAATHGQADAAAAGFEVRPRTPIRGRREPVDVYVLSLASGAA